MRRLKPKKFDPRKHAYSTWVNIKNLTTNVAHGGYKYVGGRGVSIHPEWLASFDEFLIDVGLPVPNQVLRRIDESGGYTPGNVAWKLKIEVNRKRKVT